jgi:hypothetical protein
MSFWAKLVGGSASSTATPLEELPATNYANKEFGFLFTAPPGMKLYFGNATLPQPDFFQ